MDVEVVALAYQVQNRTKELVKNLRCLPQHKSVQKLHPAVLRYVEVNEMISFQLLTHCFPSVHRLSFDSATPAPWAKLPDLFVHFPNLVWLYLKFEYDDRCSIESLLTGLSPQVCEAMTAAGIFDDSMLGGISPNAGLTNLQSLKTLELRADPDHYTQIFTKVTQHRVFTKMECLKEICLIPVFENTYPAVCPSFVEGLREKGIEFRRMNSPIMTELRVFD